MAKLRLTPDPTFKAKVGISVAGQGKVPTLFTFKHRSGPELAEWLKTCQGKTGAQIVLDCACGWELDDEFTEENVKALCLGRVNAANEIVEAYLDELQVARVKN